MKKYLQLIKITWQKSLTYRLNFVMWRFRLFLMLLTTYFIWQAIFGSNENMPILTYRMPEMMTYVLLVAVMESIVLTSRTGDIAWLINSGDFSNLLLRPISKLKLFFSEDIADKSLNIIFMFGELSLFFLLVRPSFLWPSMSFTFILFLLAVFLATLLYFFINFFIGILGFWTNQVWAARFLFTIVTGILAGSLFPLDILPTPFLWILKALPFNYLIYFPNQVFLERLGTGTLVLGYLGQLFWIFIFARIIKVYYQKGLKRYAAEGR